MKRLKQCLVPIIILIFLFGCKERTHEEIFIQYITGFNNSDFKLIEEIVADSIKIYESDFTVVKSKQEQLVHFKWDVVFKPKYEIKDVIQIDDNQSEFILSKYCQRIKFLHDTATVYKLNVIFNEGKIQEIKTNDYLVFDFQKWQSRRDTLVKWIDNHSPELNGFIYDQTQKGAENYLKAIELYEKQNSDIN